MKIITNADDLGESAATNHAIFELMQEGLVTSATVLANGAAVKEAACRIPDFPHCSFGAHLNLTEFRPLTDARRLGELVGADGNFNASVRKHSHLAALKKPILDELCAQVEHLRSLGLPVSHLDGHHHVHTIPALFPVLKAVQRRFGIRKVRRSRNLYGASELPPRTLRLKKVLFNWLLKHWYPTVTTRWFTGLEAFCEARIRIHGRTHSVEIMLHPGGVGALAETALLRQLGQASNFRAQLISYNDLA